MNFRSFPDLTISTTFQMLALSIGFVSGVKTDWHGHFPWGVGMRELVRAVARFNPGVSLPWFEIAGFVLILLAVRGH